MGPETRQRADEPDDYTLDFSGDLQRDADVSVDGGVGSLHIVIPAGTAATVIVTRGLGSLETTGAWTVSGDTYELKGAGPRLTITVKLGVGSLEFVEQT